MVDNHDGIVDLNDKKEEALRRWAIEGEKWSEREPLPPERPPAPELDPELIPECLRRYAVDEADGLQVPLGMVAAPMLVAAATAVGRSLQLEVRSGWTVVPTLWGMVIGPPGSTKSPAMQKAWRPLQAVIDERYDAWDSQHAKNDARRQRLETKLQDVQQQLDQADEGDVDELLDDVAELEEHIDALPTDPPCYMTSDATPEKLMSMLSAHPRGLTMKRDELFGWFTSFDREMQSGARKFYLTAWDGTGTHKVDRIGRGTDRVQNPTLSVLGTIQPGKARTLSREATSGGEKADGLLQRFQVIVWPDTETLADYDGDRWKQGGADEAALAEVIEVFRQLLDVPYDQESDGTRLDMTDSARELLVDWISDHIEETRQMAKTEASHPAWIAHLTKVPPTVATLTILLHAINAVGSDGSPESSDIQVETVEAAIAWHDYFRGHARKLYPPVLSPVKKAVYALAERIREGDVEHRDKVSKIQKRDWENLSRHSSDEYTATELIKEAVEQLETLGWAMLHVESNGPGRPSTMIHLHPDLRG